MTKKMTDNWDERHFQICLALIGRPNVDCYGNTKPLSFHDIIAKADRMVNLLQEREMKISAECETTEKVAK